jgi:hypothetical protein
MGSRVDSRHPLKPLNANFYRVIMTTIMVVNPGGTSPSPAHPFTVQEILIRVPNQLYKHQEPTAAGFCGIHGASAESQVNFISFSLLISTGL